MAEPKDNNTAIPSPDAAGLAEKSIMTGPKDHHPSGKESYGTAMQLLRAAAFSTYFITCCVTYELSPCFCDTKDAVIS